MSIIFDEDYTPLHVYKCDNDQADYPAVIYDKIKIMQNKETKQNEYFVLVQWSDNMKRQEELNWEKIDTLFHWYKISPNIFTNSKY